MRATQQGLSLVELMVGCTAGLFIAAAAVGAFSGQLDDNRRLVLALQVEQDLRATADLIARDLRRAGYWDQATRQLQAGGHALNPYGDLAAGDAWVRYAYAPEAGGAPEGEAYSGVKLDQGVVKLLAAEGGWQPLTDPAVLTVTSMKVTLKTDELRLSASCAASCAAQDAGSCGPVQQLRSAVIVLSGAAATDPKVQRSLQVTLRVRNDNIAGRCGG
jgi:Tfp pilus assembly protein PilW